MADQKLFQKMKKFLLNQEFATWAKVSDKDLDLFLNRLASALSPRQASLFQAEPTKKKPSRKDLFASVEEGMWNGWADGACSGNPGPMGSGALLKDPHGATVWEEAKPLGRGTNNEAEYLAVIALVEEANRLKISHLRIHSDSLLVVRQIRGTYRVKHPHLKKFHAQLKNLLQHLKWEIRHIPREENKRADELARLGRDQAPKKGKA